MAILQVGSGLQLRSASTGTKEEDYENDAATIVQKCVSIKQTIPPPTTRDIHLQKRCIMGLLFVFKEHLISHDLLGVTTAVCLCDIKTGSILCCLQLEIYEMIGQAISNSRRAGGEVS